MNRLINSFILIFFCICLKKPLNSLETQKSNSITTSNEEKEGTFTLTTPVKSVKGLESLETNKSNSITSSNEEKKGTFTLTIPVFNAVKPVKKKKSIIKMKVKDRNWYLPVQIPSTFDARKEWTKCSIIGESMLYNGQWEYSWAVATSSVFADRICIANKGLFNAHLSIKELLLCCDDCGSDENSTARAWEYYRDIGGVYEKYFYSVRDCQSGVPEIDNVKFRRQTPNIYALNAIDNIKIDIYTYGPVSAILRKYEDFEDYKTGDVYINNPNRKNTDTYELQAVKIIGWSVNTYVPYWLCLNSYGNSWNAGGTLKLAMGLNVFNIGEKLIAGTV